MLLLGQWQLSRADEKITLMERAESASLAQAVPLVSLDLVKTESASAVLSLHKSDTAAKMGEHHYTRVLVQGEWLSDQQFLWDNRIHKGVAGYEVLTPLLLSDKKLSTELALSEQPVVLVNRGWVAAESYRTVLPDIAMQLAVDDVSVEGLLTTPSKGFARGDALSPQQQDTQQQSNGQGRDWPQVLQFVDYAAIADALGTAVIAGVVQGVRLPTPEDEAAFLYTNNWSPVANGPEKHYGYAFQWFAMFIALCVIFIVTNLKNKDQTIAGHEKS